MPGTASAERDFMAEIVAAPRDDAPRLAFADWLTQRGDPRGEFIRLQCASASATPSAAQDPWQRADALLRRHEAAWVGELRELLGAAGQANYRPYTFHRGFVEELHVPADVFAAAADRLLALAPLLRSVCFMRPPRGGAFDGALARAVASRPELAVLRRLRLCHLELGDEACTGLLRSPHLHAPLELDLANNALGPASVAALLAAPFTAGHEAIDLWKNDIGDEGAALIAASAPPRLRRLRLTYNRIGPRGAIALASSPRLGALEALDLAYDPIGDDGVCALVGSETLTALRGLQLYAVGLSFAGVSRLAAEPLLARIEDLNLGGNELGDRGLALLAASPHTRGLVHLDLECSSVGDAGIEALAQARDLGRLESLELRYNRIGDAGARALATSARLPRLQELDLAYNDILHEAELLARFPCANIVGQSMREELR
ncbi:repeat-companion domain-containing protein [Nannocystis exedens]|uniref:Repeat-companion domain-containing protein n=1 Tax=Nannocystis exedens TaxID=54 RepID=A0A1I1ZCW2_9BACT|nr:TIGR02996 domain-containing protein [Nannocystis exedens]PCC75030.1 Leucine Rich repeats (2 copies) [Nannocystis exedens]SFE29664.1 repeat-companion domain-containing protein [Nannocystis exedens]